MGETEITTSIPDSSGSHYPTVIHTHGYLSDELSKKYAISFIRLFTIKEEIHNSGKDR